MPLTKITGGEFDNTQGGLSVAGIITASSDLLVSGNLGVGTIAPIVKLQVSTSGNTPIINQTTGGSTSYLMLQNTGGMGYVASNNNDIIIATSANATETARFNSSGNFGLGTNIPQYKLDVNGSIKTRATGSGTGILLHTNTGWSINSNLAQFWTSQTNGFAFYSNSLGDGTNERVRIDSSGNVTAGADAVQDLGSSTKRWANIYSADLQLSNEGFSNDVDGTWGKYTIQEGEDDLFLINRRTGKRYKFLLKEVK